jgi:DNA polymerase (family 10)
MATDNQRVARLLYELGALSERDDDRTRRFRAAAYRRAADTVAELDGDVLALSVDELTALPGVGAGTAARIDEIRRTGTVARLEELRARDPAGAEELLRVPGLGPRTVARLRDDLGVRDIAGLRAALDAEQLRTVRGLGPATEQRLRAVLRDLDLDAGETRLPIVEAVGQAGRVARAVWRLATVGSVSWSGALARLDDTIDRIELVVGATDRSRALEQIAGLPAVREVCDRGSRHLVARTFDGVDVAVMVVAPDAVGPAAIHADAAPRHWTSLQRLAEARSHELTPDALRDHTGARVAAPDAAAVYHTLGVQAVPAEQRDGTDELDLAARHALPVGADVTDLRGDLHDHSDWSGDGRMTVRELLDAAVDRGWDYVAVTDHAEDLRINGIDRATVLRQRGIIAEVRRSYDTLAILHGAELNIAVDGSVDYDPDFVAGYDWTVASVHSAFGLDVAAQTSRLVTAIHNPAVHAIGHLTGRRIGRRPGIRLDIDAVLDACHETGTALEVNCHLDRLDAPAEVLREAAARGVLVVISTDAHRLGDLGNHRWGVSLARRGRVPAAQVANSWPVGRFLDWIDASA